MINDHQKFSIFWDRYKSNLRNLYSLYIFSFIFILSLFAELISNDKPIIMSVDNTIYIPMIMSYPETEFGGVFETEANYKDKFMNDIMNKEDNWAHGLIDDDETAYENGTMIDDGTGDVSLEVNDTKYQVNHMHESDVADFIYDFDQEDGWSKVKPITFEMIERIN